MIIIEAFPKPRTAVFAKFPSQSIRTFTRYAALIKNSKQSIDMVTTKAPTKWLRLSVSLTHVVALEADYWLTGRSNEIEGKEKRPSTSGRVT